MMGKLKKLELEFSLLITQQKNTSYKPLHVIMCTQTTHVTQIYVKYIPCLEWLWPNIHTDIHQYISFLTEMFWLVSTNIFRTIDPQTLMICSTASSLLTQWQQGRQAHSCWQCSSAMPQVPVHTLRTLAVTWYHQAIAHSRANNTKW